MGDGRFVPAQSDFGRGPQQPQKFLIVLQYYDGDIDEVEDIANIMADMERVRNKDADILLFGRHDARPFPSHTKAKLQTKFDQVHEIKCRSRDGTSYPFASNCMFYDLIALLGQYPQWNQPYFAFINWEADCVPVHPGWIKELIMEFKIAQVHGKQAIGHIDLGHNTPHMNGLAVYAIDIVSKVADGALRGGPLGIAYDMYHGKTLLPFAYDTPLIAFQFRRPTITAADLFSAHKAGVEPAIYHGVKDASAREAVKARYITFSEKKDLARTTVFTYFSTSTDLGHGESSHVIELWKQGWASRGWNPVVLRLMEASRHPKFALLKAALATLPYVGDKAEQAGLFYRWLALDTVGGGLLVNMDQLPNAFTPERAGSRALDRDTLAVLIDSFINYTVKPEDVLNGAGHVTDLSVMGKAMPAVDFGAPGYKEAEIVSFSDKAIIASNQRGRRKSDVMQSYLRGEV